MSDWGEQILAADAARPDATGRSAWRAVHIRLAAVAAGVIVALLLAVANLSYVLWRGDVRDDQVAQQQSETQQLQDTLCGVLAELTATAGSPAEVARIARASTQLGCAEEIP